MSTARPAVAPSRRRSAILPTLVIIALLVIVLAIFTNLWTDRLWFASIDFSAVFSKLLFTKIGLFVAFGLVMATAVAANTAVAHRMRPRRRLNQPTSQLLERYREVLENRFVLVMIALGVLVGLFAGGAATAQVFTFLAWRNAVPFGTQDWKFGIDLSFFVFDYPWWRFCLDFVFVALLFSAAAAALVHYVVGALKLSRPGRGGTVAAQAHLSVLVGLALLVKGVGYWFDRYALEITDNQSIMTGLTYTGDQATVSTKSILAVIAVICALLFFANAVLRRWTIPVIGLVLMLLSGIVIGLIYPGAVQFFSVRPNEAEKEIPYIERHIAATRAAYGVDGVELTDYTATTTASAGQLRSDAEALPGVRLMDPAKIGPTFEQLQQVRGFYQFPATLDIDRYKIDGTTTDAVVAARELDVKGLANQSWINLHTVYTHGYGLVAAYGSRQDNGEPDWIAEGIPPTGDLAEHEPRIYFGEQQAGFSIVGSAGAAPVEFDTPTGGEGSQPGYNTYTGKGGVAIGSMWRRLLYAAKNGDVNILLSDRVNENSKILYDRSPRTRVERVAPWLTVDSDAYPSVVDGRIVWILDGYTTSNSYPNSQRTNLRLATTDSTTNSQVAAQPAESVNYMRNSVKAVVDAYDGSVKLYEWDTTDPVLKTWEKAFPGAVAPKTAISPDLLSHLRYPEDLFKVQRAILGRYHVTEPRAWLANSDLWTVPVDPTGSSQTESPYYLSIKWPEDDGPNFSLTASYVPNNRPNLIGYMAVNSDASSPDYGQLRVLRMTDTSPVDGPGQAYNTMVGNSTVADALRPYTTGSAASAVYGNLLTLPVGGGLLYVEPVYTERQTGAAKYPVLQFVLVRFGQSVAIGRTLQAALDEVFGGNSGAVTDEDGTSPDAPAGTGTAKNPAAQSQLNQADQDFEAAQKALTAGDLSAYQESIEKARQHVAAALKALNG